MTSLSSGDLGWRLGLIPNLSIKVYPWVDGDTRGGQSRNVRKTRTREVGTGLEKLFLATFSDKVSTKQTELRSKLLAVITSV